MKIIERISDMKLIIKEKKRAGKSIGFVPTMGYLHKGHVSLAEASVKENDFTVMSIFVNPTQFGPNEDFNKYPRDLKRDIEIATDAGVDVIFAPTPQEMYPEGYKTYVNVEDITDVLCGQSRKGHFKGVATVVNKLFNIIEPDRAYFGQKDAQQVIVLKKMVNDLNMNLEIVTCPIVREQDGLAMSSRNVYLDAQQRKASLVLSRSLFGAQKMVKDGERSKAAVMKYIVSEIEGEKLANIDYIEIRNAQTLGETERIEGSVLIAMAVRFGTTRLIDNAIVEV